jgi:hypothetical protein
MITITGTFDMDAFEAEMEELFIQDELQNNRAQSIIDKPRKIVMTTEQRIAAIKEIADYCGDLTDLVTRQQEELSAALDDLGI